MVGRGSDLHSRRQKNAKSVLRDGLHSMRRSDIEGILPKPLRLTDCNPATGAISSGPASPYGPDRSHQPLLEVNEQLSADPAAEANLCNHTNHRHP